MISDVIEDSGIRDRIAPRIDFDDWPANQSPFVLGETDGTPTMNPWNWMFGPPSREQFARRLIAALRAAGESRTLRFDEEGFRLVGAEKSGEMNLTNLYHEHCKLPRKDRKAHIQRLATTFVTAKEDFPESFDEVKPNLRPKIWARASFTQLELRRRLEGGTEMDLPLYPLGTHLMTGLVYDLPTSIRSISNSDLEQWGVSYYEAMEIARQNLDESTLAIAKIGDGFHSAVSGDNYDSSRVVLIDRISDWDVQGEPIAMVPQRDALYVTGSEDEAGLDIMMALAQQTMQDEPRPLSPTLLRLVDGEWEDWTLPKAHPKYAQWRTLMNQSMAGLYDEQKKALVAIHERELIDEFIATFSAIRKEASEDLLSYCVWSKSVRSLLPKTDLIAFNDGTDTTLCTWERVVDVVGSMMEQVPDLYPERYRVDDFPSVEQIQQIGEATL